MATHRELEAQIRFQLEQLSVRNGAHEFEHLCRQLARHCICSNILPATGPVEGGGDQGRDFETYQVAAGGSLQVPGFATKVSKQRIVFLCSLQRDKITSKIRSDLRKVTRSGTPVAAVHFLCSTDVPVAKRHKLQAWAATECGVTLEIHDGQWIAQELSQRDLFWIAREYLAVPQSVYPETQPSNEAYAALRQHWENARPQNLAELLDVAVGLREAAVAGGPNEDIAFWLERIDPVAVPARFRRHAIYESTLASLRGKNTMEGLEPLIREYFAKVPQLERPSELDDTAVMLGFCTGAVALGGLGIPLE